jgi:DNA-binding transcriptional LysR family regulator
MQLVSGSEHPRARRRSVQLGALVDEPFAELPQGWGTTIAVDAAFAAAGLRRTVAYEINDAATVFDFVRHGLAVAILPPSFLDDATGIAFTPIRPRAPVFERSLAIPANRRPSAAATALRDTIARRAGAEAKRRQGDAGKPPQSPGNLRGE